MAFQTHALTLCLELLLFHSAASGMWRAHPSHHAFLKHAEAGSLSLW